MQVTANFMHARMGKDGRRVWGNVKDRARSGREKRRKKERMRERESERAFSRLGIEFAEDLHFVLCNSCGHVVRRLPRWSVKEEEREGESSRADLSFVPEENYAPIQIVIVCKTSLPYERYDRSYFTLCAAVSTTDEYYRRTFIGSHTCIRAVTMYVVHENVDEKFATREQL